MVRTPVMRVSSCCATNPHFFTRFEGANLAAKSHVQQNFRNIIQCLSSRRPHSDDGSNVCSARFIVLQDFVRGSRSPVSRNRNVRVCVRACGACVHACLHACVHACVRVRVHVYVSVCACARVRPSNVHFGCHLGSAGLVSRGDRLGSLRGSPSEMPKKCSKKTQTTMGICDFGCSFEGVVGAQMQHPKIADSSCDLHKKRGQKTAQTYGGEITFSSESSKHSPFFAFRATKLR